MGLCLLEQGPPAALLFVFHPEVKVRLHLSGSSLLSQVISHDLPAVGNGFFPECSLNGSGHVGPEFVFFGEIQCLFRFDHGDIDLFHIVLEFGIGIALRNEKGPGGLFNGNIVGRHHTQVDFPPEAELRDGDHVDELYVKIPIASPALEKGDEEPFRLLVVRCLGDRGSDRFAGNVQTPQFSIKGKVKREELKDSIVGLEVNLVECVSLGYDQCLYIFS